MKLTYNKKISILLLLISIALFVYGVFFFIDAMWDGFHIGLAYIAGYAFSILLIIESVFLFILYLKYRKGEIDIQKSGKKLGIMGFVITSFALVWGIPNSIVFSNSIMNWAYFSLVGLSILMIILCIIFICSTKKYDKQGYTGFSLYRNHFRMIICMMIHHIFHYILSICKGVALILLMEEVEKEVPDEQTVELAGIWFLAFIGMMLVITFFIVIVTFYFSFVEFISAKENIPLELRRGMSTTKKMLTKYEIMFWIGNVSNIILGITAIFSLFTTGLSYLGLAVLYIVLVFIRIPSLFWRKDIETKYRGDDYQIYKEKHRIVIYIGTFLLVLAVAAIFFGTGSSTKFNSDYGEVLIFGVFIPYSIVRIILGIIGFRKAYKKGDPYFKVSSSLDIMISIFTIGNTSYMLSAIYSETDAVASNVWLTIAIVISYIMIAYALIVAIITIVIGIRGLKGKREEEYKKHEEDIKKINGFRFEKITDTSVQIFNVNN